MEWSTTHKKDATQDFRAKCNHSKSYCTTYSNNNYRKLKHQYENSMKLTLRQKNVRTPSVRSCHCRRDKHDFHKNVMPMSDQDMQHNCKLSWRHLYFEQFVELQGAYTQEDLRVVAW